MEIDGQEIGGDTPPYIVAEIGASHAGNLDLALRLIEDASLTTADAVKFQAYTPDTMTIDCDKPDFIIKDGPWKGRKLYELYQKAHTPFEWFPTLFQKARDCRITIFSSVFDKTSVDMLEKLDCPAYKIASMEITDIPLIKYAASTGKPMIISTGMATHQEIEEARDAVNVGNTIRLLCTSGYPTPLAEAPLCRIGGKGLYRADGEG